jgi:hypothetical protein
MKPIPKLLSKTRLLKGFRCLKCIYLTLHHPELEAPITPDTQALFDQGNMIGAKAREYYPGGILVNNAPWDFSGALAKTRELLAVNTPVIYEAAFEYMGCYARADIIKYSPDTKRWRIYEVKSSTKVKPEHYDDIGVQAWIIAKSGLPIEQINIVHLNSECCYPDLSNLFKEVDATAEIRKIYPDIQPKIQKIFSTIREPNEPDIDIGPYCLEPTECGFTEYCWKQKNIPEISVFNFPGSKDYSWELYQQGIIQLDDPRLTNLNEVQERIVSCYKSEEQYLDTNAIHEEISGWKYPFIFLDFETINPAIPRYEGCKPFSQVPFQFSAHTLKTLHGDATHHEFLHLSASDPRPDLIPALLHACGEEGSIVAYNAKFEKSRIQELAEFSPKHADALLKLLDRFVDPLLLMRKAVYDNAFAGSFGLKSVAPALLGEASSYDGMMVADGGAAQRAFEELISERTSAGRKAELEGAMRGYCGKDTWVMVEVVRWFFGCRK